MWFRTASTPRANTSQSRQELDDENSAWYFPSKSEMYRVAGDLSAWTNPTTLPVSKSTTLVLNATGAV
jgi:hypothetical protein